MITPEDYHAAQEIDRILIHYKAWNFYPTQPPDFDHDKAFFRVSGKIKIKDEIIVSTKIVSPLLVYSAKQIEDIVHMAVTEMTIDIYNLLVKKD